MSPRWSRRLLLSALIAGSTLAPSLVAAQTCTAGPAFDARRWQLDAGALSGSPHRAIGLQLTAGGSGGFLRLGAGGEEASTAGEFRLGGGYRVPIGASGRIEACPFVQIAYAVGPDDIFDRGGNITDRLGTGFGAALGASFRANRHIQLQPAVQLGVEFEQTAWNRRDSPLDSAATERFGYASVAVGIVIADVVNIRPSLTLPGAARGRQPLYGLALGFGFWRREP